LYATARAGALERADEAAQLAEEYVARRPPSNHNHHLASPADGQDGPTSVDPRYGFFF
jgi:hypothetical protein